MLSLDLKVSTTRLCYNIKKLTIFLSAVKKNKKQNRFIYQALKSLSERFCKSSPQNTSFWIRLKSRSNTVDMADA